MQHSNKQQKQTQNHARNQSNEAAAGKQGAALAPPSYGMAFLDAAIDNHTSGQPLQLQSESQSSSGAAADAPPVNRTGLPDKLKAGIESLSGINMDHVRVHYNSDKPAKLQAHAYAQGSDIHLAAGQEQHLAHEAWHVVQQAQGRVKPTLQMKAEVAVNDEVGLEREADAMGAKALGFGAAQMQQKANVVGVFKPIPEPIIQRRLMADDRTLAGDVNDTVTRTGKAGLSLFEVLVTIATNYGNVIPPEADEAVMSTLLCVGLNPVLDQEDCDFIRLKVEAITRSEAYADQRNTVRLNLLGQNATQEKATHLDRITAAAKIKLSNRHQRGLEQPTGSDKYKAAKSALDRSVDADKVVGLTAIDDQLALDQDNSTNVTMPQDYAAKKLQYDNFLTATGQHPLSFKALDLANNNIGTAQNIIASVRLYPALAVLVTDPASSLALWQNCIGTLTDVVTSALLGRITFAELRAFNGVNQGLNLLNALHAQVGIADLKISAVAADLAHFGSYAPNGGTRLALAGLLVANPVVTLKTLFEAMTMVPSLQKPIELVALLPRAQNWQALLGGLQLASPIGLTQVQLNTIITALPFNSTLLAITAEIETETLSTINRLTHFAQWIGAIEGFMVHSGFTITVGGSYDLTGGHTKERLCTVRDVGRNIIDSFVIHYHPGAAAARVGSPYASAKHIKPVSGNAATARLYWESIPVNVKGRLPNSW